jgi:hypothetical protein
VRQARRGSAAKSSFNARIQNSEQAWGSRLIKHVINTLATGRIAYTAFWRGRAGGEASYPRSVALRFTIAEAVSSLNVLQNGTNDNSF